MRLLIAVAPNAKARRRDTFSFMGLISQKLRQPFWVDPRFSQDAVERSLLDGFPRMNGNRECVDPPIRLQSAHLDVAALLADPNKSEAFESTGELESRNLGRARHWPEFQFPGG